jgi:hypothetical protein
LCATPTALTRLIGRNGTPDVGNTGLATALRFADVDHSVECRNQLGNAALAQRRECEIVKRLRTHTIYRLRETPQTTRSLVGFIV